MPELARCARGDGGGKNVLSCGGVSWSVLGGDSEGVLVRSARGPWRAGWSVTGPSGWSVEGEVMGGGRLDIGMSSYGGRVTGKGGGFLAERFGVELILVMG